MPSQNPGEPVIPLNPVPYTHSHSEFRIYLEPHAYAHLAPQDCEHFIQAFPERMTHLFLVPPGVPQLLRQVLGSLGPLGSEPPGSLLHEDEGLLPTAHQLQEV